MADMGKVLNTLKSTQAGRVQKSPDVLLAKYDSASISDIFTVTDTPIRLVAFGLNAQDVVHVMRLHLPTAQSERDACGRLEDTGEFLEKNYTVGGQAVALNAKLDELVLDAKGSYRLLFEGGNRPDVQLIKIDDPVVFVNDFVRGVGK